MQTWGRAASPHARHDAGEMSQMRGATGILNLSDFAPGSPPFDVTAYWIDVIVRSVGQFRDAVQTLLDTPESSSSPRIFPLSPPPAVMKELRHLKLPLDQEKFIVDVLAGALGAREHYDVIARGRRPDRADHRRILRAASRWPGTVGSREVVYARASLALGRSLDRLLPQLLRGARTRPEKLYLKLCVRALAETFRKFTGRPHHDLTGRLMLRAGVLGGSAHTKSCRPWDSMASSNVRCRAKTGGFCAHPCRKADALIRQLGRPVRYPPRRRNPVK